MKRCKYKIQTIKLPENTGENLCDLELGKHVLACKKPTNYKEKKKGDKLDFYQNLRYLLFKRQCHEHEETSHRPEENIPDKDKSQ